MEKFTASNGVTVHTDVHGCVTVAGIESLRDSSQALREFFLHERDEELGRWRWPENPQYVVYPREVPGHTDSEYQECQVIDEATGGQREFGSELPRCHGGPFREAARAYFAAHPVTKPWHDAKPGEVWACVQSDHPGEEHAYWVNDSGSFIDISDGGGIYGDDRECIESARRIWPEENPCSTP